MNNTHLPKRIKIGRTNYEVATMHEIEDDPRAMGRISYGLKRIEIATKYPAVEVRNTFWHEVTHGILQDMGSELTDNERFVVAFANRLSDAIDSAKF